MKRAEEIRNLAGGASFAALLVVCAFAALISIGLAAPGNGAISAEIQQLPAAVQNGNNALFFDGVDDYLEIPEIAAIRTETQEPLTVEFWMYIQSYPPSWRKVLSKWGARGGEDDEFVVCLRKTGCFGIADTGSTGVDSRTTVPTNQWCHLCIVWDKANGYQQLYVNAEPVPLELDGGSPLRLTGEPIRIGTDGHRNNCFAGMLDEVRFWNVARTPADVRATMNRKLTGDEPGLVGYWDFDEGVDQIVSDLSCKGNRGRLGRLPFPDDSDPTWVASGVELFDSRGNTR